MGKYTPDITGIDGPLAYSNEDVVLYVQLPAQPYEFRQARERESLAREMELGLQSLITSNETSVEVRLHVTSVPFDNLEWAQALDERIQRNNPSYAWDGLLGKMFNYMEQQAFRSREVYLGIVLGKRSEFRSTNVFASLRSLSDFLSGFLSQPDFSISDPERRFWNDRSRAVQNIVRNGLKGTPVQAETVARLVKETLYPGMPVENPEAGASSRWGKGELESLGMADIYNNPKYLKIKQFQNGKEVEGYKATLCFARFPDTIDFPYTEPWIHVTALLPYPTTMFSSFTIEPASKVLKVVNKKEKDATDQAKNSGENAPIAVIEQLDEARELKHALSRERRPWLFGRHRISVTAATKEALDANVQEIIDLYKNLGITVVLPSGDQMNLLLESQPAGKVRSKAYNQNQELGIIPVGMPSGSGKVGDQIAYDEKTHAAKGWLGPYLGYTISRVEEPVFLSIHSAIARDSPPGCTITGAPGGGKTFAGLTLTYMMAIQNVWTIMIDPKGDALPMLNLPGLENSHLIDLGDKDASHDGILDPFTLGNDQSEQKLLALEVISLFLKSRMEAKEENAVSKAIKGAIDEAARGGFRPSMNLVLAKLAEDSSPEGERVANQLSLISELPFARLCFGQPNQNRTQLRAEDGLTVISLKGLNLPATPNQDSYTLKNWLAVGIMYLLTNYTESLMFTADQKHQKAVVIDEAWAITSTPQGQALIERIARMGRSLNTAIVCISQNAGDFLNLTNSMPYRLAFGSRDEGEINNVCKFLGLEHDDEGKPLQGSFKTVEGLNRGECLMRDPDGRIQKVRIDNWNQEMFDAFNTNPDSKKEYKKKTE